MSANGPVQNPVATTVTLGYLNGPPASGQAVQFMYVDTAPDFYQPASCVLTTPYWRVDAAGNVTQFIAPGGCLSATRGEVSALLGFGAAVGI